MKFGAIDIGTNAARLLIGEVCQSEDHNYVKKISYTRIPLRLGDDVFEIGKISKEKARNTIDTMKAFKLIAKIFDVNKLRAVATSAMRESSNSTKIIEKVKEKSGIEIEVITGQEEAELIFGTFMLLDFDKTIPFVVIDVGGGSTEISFFNSGQKVASRSFEVGTIRLLKKKVDESIWREMAFWLKENIPQIQTMKLFGTGGNINKIHKIVGCKDNEPVSIKSINKLYKSLKPLSIEDRIDLFHLKPDRADVIIPAMEIYVFIMEKINIQKIDVPKIGLSDGMIYKMFLDSIENK
jgi:exopolyphosphatase/guanosine-5'-triphosphate,3'-diphosphate pyrophosphatase